MQHSLQHTTLPYTEVFPAEVRHHAKAENSFLADPSGFIDVLGSAVVQGEGSRSNSQESPKCCGVAFSLGEALGTTSCSPF